MIQRVKDWCEEAGVYFCQEVFGGLVVALGVVKLLAIGVVVVLVKLVALAARRRSSGPGPGPGADVPA